ncbi:MAG: glycosyltransferase family 2 protein [Balneolales bacterium]
MNNQPTSSTPKIAVLMSTLNGIHYLNEQIDSILAQQDVQITIFIRDDGSKDGTLSLLENYATRFPQIKVDTGENIGVFASFMKLLKDAGTGFDMYAFCDQDDYWKPDKLFRAAKKIGLQQNNSLPTIPCMYYSRLEFTDERLRTIGYSTIPTTHGFNNALVQNQATGCTVVLNVAARNLICSKIPDWALMHDWWCYLVTSAFGHVCYDDNPGILYRKHKTNVTPATPNFLMELYARTLRFMGHNDIPEKVTDQARIFLQCFGEKLSGEKHAILKGFLNARDKALFGRIRYAVNMPVRRNTPLDNLIMRLLVILGRF